MVSIIIVTAGLSPYFRQCLVSALSQEDGTCEIIVIDNSIDKKYGLSLKDHPGIKLYLSPQNLYYCQALNIGIKMSKGDFLLCLNDDVILEKDFVKQVLNAFSLDNRIGMVSAKILRMDKKTIDSTGLFLSIWRTAKERGYGQPDTGLYEKPEYIFGVNGAVAFYRRCMLDDIKSGEDYFDADYNIFYEDLDIAWRAQNAGWKAYYVPSALAYHARGLTARQNKGTGKANARIYMNTKLNYDLIKNRLLTIIKNESLAGLILHLPFMLAYDIFTLVYILLFRPAVIRQAVLKPLPIKSAFRKRAKINCVSALAPAKNS